MKWSCLECRPSLTRFGTLILSHYSITIPLEYPMLMVMVVIHLHFEADTPQHPILFKVGIRWSSIYIFIQWAYSFIEKYSVTRHQSTLITEPRSSLNLGLVPITSVPLC